LSNPSGARETKTAFGLDLGGYSSGGSALVRATRRPTGEVEATVYREHAFSKKPARGKPFASIVEQEVELLAACLQNARLYVDVPIDLQGLPCPGDEIYAWELTKRPADFAFEALPPLADRIGSVVARFQNLLRSLPSECADDLLGRRLFETYPAGSLRLSGLPHEGYKEKNSRITVEGDRWTGHGPKGERLACIANKLRMTASPGTQLDHDEVDAVVCALAGVVDDSCLLRGEALEDAISNVISDDQVDPSPPEAYVLMRQLPDDLCVAVKIGTAYDLATVLEGATGG
jgi:hypothetical protein